MYYGLYTKFEKSKTKNTDSQLFFSTEFWNPSSLTSRQGSCYREYSFTEFIILSVAYSQTPWLTGDFILVFFFISLMSRLWYSYCSISYSLFSSFSWKKRASSRVCSISSFRCSGDCIYCCNARSCMYSYYNYIFCLRSYSFSRSTASNLTRNSISFSITYYFYVILFFTKWKNSCGDPELSR